MKGFIIIGLVVVACIGGLLWLFRHGEGEEPYDVWVDDGLEYPRDVDL